MGSEYWGVGKYDKMSSPAAHKERRAEKDTLGARAPPAQAISTPTIAAQMAKVDRRSARVWAGEGGGGDGTIPGGNRGRGGPTTLEAEQPDFSFRLAGQMTLATAHQWTATRRGEGVAGGLARVQPNPS